jgi:indoleacetamide hydrolase
MRSSTTGELHELGLAAAVRAIRNREVSSETYVTTLLERAWEQANRRRRSQR